LKSCLILSIIILLALVIIGARLDVEEKHPTQAREATMTIEGFQLAGQAQAWLQDEEHPTAEKLSTLTVAETFPYNFPPYSVTLLTLDPAPRVGCPLWAYPRPLWAYPRPLWAYPRPLWAYPRPLWAYPRPLAWVC